MVKSTGEAHEHSVVNLRGEDSGKKTEGKSQRQEENPGEEGTSGTEGSPGWDGVERLTVTPTEIKGHPETCCQTCGEDKPDCEGAEVGMGDQEGETLTESGSKGCGVMGRELEGQVRSRCFSFQGVGKTGRSDE